MIHIFYNTSAERLNEKTFNHLFQQLPEAIQKPLLRFRKWEDMQRGLLGKSLLMYGLESLQISYSLNDLQYTAFKRPWFDDKLDFNISHSGSYTICAISTNKKIGIDVEEIKDIDIKEFTNEFSEKEIDDMLQSKNSLYQFYNLWTKKEAFLKAIGTGLNVPLHVVNIKNNRINWSNTEWFFTEIQLDRHHVSHLCSNEFQPKILMEKIDFI